MKQKLNKINRIVTYGMSEIQKNKGHHFLEVHCNFQNMCILYAGKHANRPFMNINASYILFYEIILVILESSFITKCEL